MADNLTTPVPDGIELAFKDLASVFYALNMIVDQGGADAMGLVTANPAAQTVLGRLKAIADLLDDATPAGENYLGKLGGDVLSGAQVPTTAAGAYASGDVIGTKMTFASMARIAAGSGILQSLVLHSKVALTGAVDVLLFSADPTASTFTDNAAVNVNVADFDKLIGVVPLTSWVSLGTPSFAQAHGIGMAFDLPAGQSLYAVLVARAAATLSTVDDLKLALNVIPG